MRRQEDRELGRGPWFAVLLTCYLALTAAELARVVAFDRPVEGAVGMYAWEETPGRDLRFRWTTSAASMLEPMRAPVMTIGLRVARVAEGGTTVRLTVDGELLDELRIGTRQWQYLSYYLPVVAAAKPAGDSVPPSAREPAARDIEEHRQRELWPWRRPPAPPAMQIALAVDETMTPGTGAPASDPRELGVAVAELRWGEQLPVSGAGFYDFELAADGRMFRWTRVQASQALTVEGERVSFGVRVHHPDAAARPVGLRIYWNERLERELLLNNHDWRQVTMAPPASVGERGILTVRASRVWIPAETDASSDDRRTLGVALTEPHWR